MLWFFRVLDVFWVLEISRGYKFGESFSGVLGFFSFSTVFSQIFTFFFLGIFKFFGDL